MLNIQNKFLACSVAFACSSVGLAANVITNNTKQEQEQTPIIQLEKIKDRQASAEEIKYHELLEQAKQKKEQEKQEQEHKKQEQELKQKQNTQISTGKGLTKSSGVNHFNGMKETYYSSRVLHHKDTAKWSVDSEGFYRDSNGYYVVACNGTHHAMGETFQTSKGTAIRLDTCPNAGIIDFYVNF